LGSNGTEHTQEATKELAKGGRYTADFKGGHPRK
jgi:hypothetical protein